MKPFSSFALHSAPSRPKDSEATVRGNIISTRCFIDMFLLLLLRDRQGFTAPQHDMVP